MATDYFGIHVPFLDMLGVKAELDGAGQPFVYVDVRPELMNSFRVTHGGVIMTLLDVAMAMSARVSARHKGGAVTVDMSMSFLRPVSGRVTARGRVLHHGRSLYFCEGEALGDDGAVIAKSLGTFKLRKEMHHGEGN